MRAGFFLFFAFFAVPGGAGVVDVDEDGELSEMVDERRRLAPSPSPSPSSCGDGSDSFVRFDRSRIHGYVESQNTDMSFETDECALYIWNNTWIAYRLEEPVVVTASSTLSVCLAFEPEQREIGATRCHFLESVSVCQRRYLSGP